MIEAPDHLMLDAERLLDQARRLRATYQVVWGPGKRGAGQPGYRVDRASATLAYLEQEPWRLIGVYNARATVDDLAEDLRAWRDEHQHAY